MKYIILLIIVIAVLYVHYRGRVRYRFWRQLSDHSTFTAPLNGFMYLFSRVPNTPYLRPEMFPELAILQQNWQVIRDEGLHLQQLEQIKAADKYNDAGFNSFFKTGWKRFYLKWYEDAHPSASQLCPQTTALLRDIPSVKAAMFATLPDGSRLPRHRDPYAGSLRFHLGLATPNDDRCFIEVDGQRYNRPVRGNQFGLMTHATVMFARSIPTANIEQLYADYLRVNQDEANRRQDWYPPIWRPSSGFTVRSTRPTLSCAEKTFDTQIEGDRTEVRFDYLHPEFTERYGANDARWVNVVKLKNWSNTSRAATVYPCNYRSPKMPRFQSIQRSILSTTEGFVVFCRFHNMSDLWRLSDGTTAISEWLKNNGVESQISDAGQATQQIINTLGGFRGISSFAHAEIVKLLNKISRRPISPSIQHQEFQNKINNVVKGDIWRNKNAETLVELGAVELGLELKCAKCSTWGWHALRELDLVVACGLCLNKFSFPMIDPSSSQLSRWAYRLIGPFALPDYARGGYAASLTLRFLANTFGNHDATITWSTGQILTLAPKQYIEADLILWHRRKVFNELDHHAELVFGEAKSFRGENSEEKKAVADAFEVEDVERMKQLAIRFPGAILVFATMKQAGDLSPAEIQRITKLASWGREYIHERRQTRAPVILLTGLELFAPYSLSQAWDAAGGRHAEMGKGHFGYTDNLRVLADMTQQLYLNMPAYSEWLRAKWEKRNQRRQVRQAAAVPARDAGDH